ncbi:fatty acid resistance MFS efflux transporter adaptor subunit FarA [Helicobacter pylori]
MTEPTRTPRRNKTPLLVLTLIFAAIGIYWGVKHFGTWQYQESSENAYVNGHLVQISAQIPGRVSQILVDDNDTVQAGQVLAVLDDNNAVLALEKARSQLIQAVRQNARLHSSVNAAQAQSAAQLADVKRAQVAVQKAEADWKRREALRGVDAVSAEEAAHAKNALDNARATLQAAQAAARSAKAQEQAQRDAVGNAVPLEQQPDVLAAASQFKEAWLAVRRTQIVAPVSGQVAKRSVQLGQQISAGAPLMAIVPMTDLWVDVNFKETQLVNIKVGQSVDLVSDFYGEDVKFKGVVQGLSAGTGSAFSLLPAQNATGNWIKVVQRVPVRVLLDKQELAAHPLRIGLSMHAVVDTRQAGQPVNAAAPKRNGTPVSIPVEDLSQADKLVAEIIAANR